MCKAEHCCSLCFLLFLLFFLRYVLGYAGIHSSITHSPQLGSSCLPPPIAEGLALSPPAPLPVTQATSNQGGWSMILKRQDGFGYPLFAGKTNPFLAAWILQLSHGNSCLASCRAST